MSESEALGGDDVLAVEDRPRKRVEVPEWGGHVYVATIGGDLRDEWEVDCLDPATGAQKRSHIRARLLVRCLVDSEGRRLFRDDQVADLSRKSARALQRCFDVALRLNRLRKADLEELEGNSPAGPSAGSGSG